MIEYNTPNKAKPRYDNGGTEFGLMHRDLGPGFLMFDIDRLHASISAELRLKRENEAFVEYRQSGETVNFIAMFEVKSQKTRNSMQALNPNNSSSIARCELARLCGCRLFVVFATNGGQPFDFYEVDTGTRHTAYIGRLSYNDDTKQRAVSLFWREVLKITR